MQTRPQAAAHVANARKVPGTVLCGPCSAPHLPCLAAGRGPVSPAVTRAASSVVTLGAFSPAKLFFSCQLYSYFYSQLPGCASFISEVWLFNSQGEVSGVPRSRLWHVLDGALCVQVCAGKTLRAPGSWWSQLLGTLWALSLHALLSLNQH